MLFYSTDGMGMISVAVRCLLACTAFFLVIASQCDSCGELCPDFVYSGAAESGLFVNHSLVSLAALPHQHDHEISPRCRSKLLREYRDIDVYRTRSRCSFAPLDRLCVLGREHIKPEDTDTHTEPVFFVMLSGDPLIALKSADKILNSQEVKSGLLLARFIFHIDSSTDSSEVWNNVADWASNPTYGRSVHVIDRDLATDVEWCDISIVEAQLFGMKKALNTWSNMTSFVTISDSHYLVAPVSNLLNFFRRHKSENFAGSHSLTRGSDVFWKYILNDITFMCDRQVVHVGWRDDPFSNANELYHTTNLYSFWSVEFVRYAVNSSVGLGAVQSLLDRLKYTTNSDEIFWGTLFFNSPFCHTAAHLDRSIGEEVTALTWNSHCRTADTNVFAPDCTHMHMQPLSWWYGQSPKWVVPSEAPLLITRQPLFARKVSSNKSGLEFINTIEKWQLDFEERDRINNASKAFPFLLSSGKGKKRQCLQIVEQLQDSIGVGWKWVHCSKRRSGELADTDTAPTEFYLRDCVGPVLNGSHTIGDDLCAAGSDNEGLPFYSSILPGGYLFGHCKISSMSSKKATDNMCLSPFLLSMSSGIAEGSLRYEDIYSRRKKDEMIGFIPCQNIGSVGAVEQLFAFHRERGLIEVASKHTVALELGGVGAGVASAPQYCLKRSGDVVSLEDCHNISSKYGLKLIKSGSW